MPTHRPRKRRTAPPRRRSARSARTPPRPRFVGRDASPVLDTYPPRTSSPAPLPPPLPKTRPSELRAAPAAGPGPAGVPPPGALPAPPEGLIRLDRPFDVDEFSTLLGETSVRVTVPRDALPEVLRRVTDFMGFGIYVYAISVRPAASELLNGFVLELQRVDYDPETKAWKRFVEKGAVTDADAPSGP